MKWFLLILVSIMSSYSDTLFATSSAVLGDNDTRATVKQICYEEAKRLLVEKVGSFISSKTTIDNYKLTADRIQSFSAGSIKIVDQDFVFSFVSGTLQVTVYLKGYVNPFSVERELRKEMERDSINNAPIKEPSPTVVNNYYTVYQPQNYQSTISNDYTEDKSRDLRIIEWEKDFYEQKIRSDGRPAQDNGFELRNGKMQ